MYMIIIILVVVAVPLLRAENNHGQITEYFHNFFEVVNS